MIRQVIEAVEKMKDYRKLQGLVFRLCQENEKLRLENAKLRKENRDLRRRLQDVELRLLRRAEADALLMGGLFFAGQSISRRACQEVGIGDKRWTRSMALLRVARLLEGRHIRVECPEEFERALTVAKQRVEKQGMDILRWRTPLCRQ